MVDDPETIYVPPVFENPIEEILGENDPDVAILPADMAIIDEPEVLEVPDIDTEPFSDD